MANPRPRPCASCPYRRDAPSGVWAAEEYERLRAWDAPIGEQPAGLFLCHQADGHLCSGWVAHRDPIEMLGLRIAVMTGAVGPEVMAYTTCVPLFASGAEAAEHGMADLETPSEAAIITAEKVRRVQRARGKSAD